MNADLHIQCLKQSSKGVCWWKYGCENINYLNSYIEIFYNCYYLLYTLLAENRPESSQEGWILSLEKIGFLNNQCKIAMSLSTSITSWAVIQCKGCVNLQFHWKNPPIKEISIEKAFCWAGGLFYLLWLSTGSTSFPSTPDRYNWWMLVILARTHSLRDMMELLWNLTVGTKSS